MAGEYSRVDPADMRVIFAYGLTSEDAELCDLRKSTPVELRLLEARCRHRRWLLRHEEERDRAEPDRMARLTAESRVEELEAELRSSCAASSNRQFLRGCARAPNMVARRLRDRTIGASSPLSMQRSS